MKEKWRLLRNRTTTEVLEQTHQTIGSEIFKSSALKCRIKLVLAGKPLISVGWRSDVVDLEDHFDQLRGQQDLGLLAVQRLDDVLLSHVWKETNNKVLKTFDLGEPHLL